MPNPASESAGPGCLPDAVRDTRCRGRAGGRRGRGGGVDRRGGAPPGPLLRPRGRPPVRRAGTTPRPSCRHGPPPQSRGLDGAGAACAHASAVRAAVPWWRLARASVRAGACWRVLVCVLARASVRAGACQCACWRVPVCVLVDAVARASLVAGAPDALPCARRDRGRRRARRSAGPWPAGSPRPARAREPPSPPHAPRPAAARLARRPARPLPRVRRRRHCSFWPGRAGPGRAGPGRAGPGFRRRSASPYRAAGHLSAARHARSPPSSGMARAAAAAPTPPRRSAPWHHIAAAPPFAPRRSIPP
jgi:hypothetical protein